MPGGGEILAAASLSHIGHHSLATNKLCYRRYPLSTENSSEREIGVSTNRTSGLSVWASDADVSVGPDQTRYPGLFALAAAVTVSPVGGGGTSYQKRGLLDLPIFCDFHQTLPTLCARASVRGLRTELHWGDEGSVGGVSRHWATGLATTFPVTRHILLSRPLLCYLHGSHFLWTKAAHVKCLFLRYLR